MHFQTIAGIVFGTICVSCFLVSTHFFYQELGEVNRKLPDNQQISYLWWYAEKYSKVRDEYKRLYPDGKLHRLQFWFQIAGFVFPVLAAAADGFFKNW